MKTSIKQAEPYSAPAIEVLAVEAGRTIMQQSPSGENPQGIGHGFGDPIYE